MNTKNNLLFYELCNQIEQMNPQQIRLHPATLMCLVAYWEKDHLPPPELWPNYALLHVSPCNLIGVPTFYDLALPIGVILLD